MVEIANVQKMRAINKKFWVCRYVIVQFIHYSGVYILK